MRLTLAKKAELPGYPERGAEVVSVSDLSVRLGRNHVLKGVDLSVKAGELLALVGPNGVGKSTLLAALCGDVPSKGEIRIAGKALEDWKLRELARFRAVLPQSNPLSFPFLVRDVVEMGRAPWHNTEFEADDDEAIEQAMARMEVTQFAERPYPRLSGGERARVALARVIAQRPALLLLDEPTAALDIRHQETVLQLARERADAGDTAIVVLHDLSLAAAYADTLVLLSDGHVRASGTPTEVLTPEAISDVYQHPVDVMTDPRTNKPIVVPVRSHHDLTHATKEPRNGHQ